MLLHGGLSVGQCLGVDMAQLEAKTIVATLLPLFRFELVPRDNITYAVTLTLPVKDGLFVTVSARD